MKTLRVLSFAAGSLLVFVTASDYTAAGLVVALVAHARENPLRP